MSDTKTVPKVITQPSKIPNVKKQRGKDEFKEKCEFYLFIFGLACAVKKGNFTQKLYFCRHFIIVEVVSNLCDFLSSVEHKRRYFEECREPNC